MIADAKRGDIGSTARAYASAFVEPRGEGPPLADSVTVNPYLGRDSLEPFLDACRRDGAGLFCLVKTSNPGSADVQDATLADGRPLWQHVAGLVHEWGADLVGERGLSAVGAVVGATFPREVAEAGGSCRRPCCCCRASVRRARAGRRRRARSRAARRARSSPRRAR